MTAKTITSKVTKGDITVIYFTDGTFWVCAGPIEEFLRGEVPVEAEILEPKKEKEVVEKKQAKEEEPEEPVQKKEEPVEGPDEYWTREDIEDMVKKELIELIEDEELDIDPDEVASVRKLRKMVIEELGIED